MSYTTPARDAATTLLHQVLGTGNWFVVVTCCRDEVYDSLWDTLAEGNEKIYVFDCRTLAACSQTFGVFSLEVAREHYEKRGFAQQGYTPLLIHFPHYTTDPNNSGEEKCGSMEHAITHQAPYTCCNKCMHSTEQKEVNNEYEYFKREKADLEGDGHKFTTSTQKQFATFLTAKYFEHTLKPFIEESMEKRSTGKYW